MRSSPLGLTADDLRRTEWGIGNHGPYRVEVTDDLLRILPPRTPWVSWIVGSIVIGGAFVGFWWLLGQLQSTGRADTHPLIRPGVLVFGSIVLGGVILGWVLSHRAVVRRGVPLAFDRRARTFTILNGAHTFHADDVVAIHALTEWNRYLDDRLGNRCGTELAIIVRRENDRNRHPLLATDDGRANSLEYVLRPLRRITQVPVLHSRRQGFAQRGDMITEAIE